MIRSFTSRIYLRFQNFLLKRQNKQFLARLKYCGDNVSIRQPVCLEGMDQIEIGDDVSIAAFVHMWGHGGIKIGNRVMIASHASIATITHDYTKLQMYNTIISKPIIIEDDVWIGFNTIILKGVRIGRGAIIGAGSIVTKDIAPWTVNVGNPIRECKSTEI